MRFGLTAACISLLILLCVTHTLKAQQIEAEVSNVRVAVDERGLFSLLGTDSSGRPVKISILDESLLYVPSGAFERDSMVRGGIGVNDAPDTSSACEFRLKLAESRIKVLEEHTKQYKEQCEAGLKECLTKVAQCH